MKDDVEASSSANDDEVFHPNTRHNELVDRCDLIINSKVSLSMKKIYIFLAGCIMFCLAVYGVMISYFVYHTHATAFHQAGDSFGSELKEGDPDLLHVYSFYFSKFLS
ncbi:hypothetical protein P3L10_011889 [Capsicum annuum]